MAPTNDPQAIGGERIRYVCLPGSPFTGSTLLGTLLNEHPDCASVGAATGLIGRVDLSTYRCSCGQLFLECEFWNHVAAATRARGHEVNVFQTNFWNTRLRLSRNHVIDGLFVRSLRSDLLTNARDAVVWKLPMVKAAIADAGWNTWSLASAVLERTGKTVFIDTARDHQRPKYLARHPLLDVRAIHLIRDPRGNSASIMKHQGVDIREAARQWTHSNVEADRVRRYLPSSSWMLLHYEELCADPKGVFDRIADFVGIPRATIQVQSNSADRHIIGNSMRLRALSEIREDRSWQTKLSGTDLVHLARIAGPASRRLGYDWP